MIRGVKSEVLKLSTTRTFWGLAGVTVGLVVLVTVLTLAFDSQLHTEDDVRSLLSAAGGAGLLMIILGVVFSAGEYRHGTIASTLLVMPDRTRAVTSKVLACAGAGLVIGLVAAVLTAAIGIPWLSVRNDLSLSTGELLGLFSGGVLYTALACSLGAGVGALVRNQVGAVVFVLVLLFVIDPALSALSEGYAKVSLGGLGTSMSGGPPSDASPGALLPFWAATLIWSAYTGLVLIAAIVLTSRRDI